MVSTPEAVSDPIQALAELLQPALEAEGFALPSQDRSDAIRTAIQAGPCSASTCSLHRADSRVQEHCLSACSAQAVQGLFRYAVSAKEPTPASQKKLHVEGFDAEQIWAQLESQAAVLSLRARRLIKAVPQTTMLTTKETEQDLDGSTLSHVCIVVTIVGSTHPAGSATESCFIMNVSLALTAWKDGQLQLLMLYCTVGLSTLSSLHSCMFCSPAYLCFQTPLS